MQDRNRVFETVVLGGGPAGISCGLECQDSGVDFIVLEREQRIGGQLPLVPGPLPNFAGGAFKTGDKLREEMEVVCATMIPERVVTGCNVESVDLSKLEVNTNDGVFRAKTLVLATGYRYRKLELDVPDTIAGDVFYKAPGDEVFAGAPAAIVGSRDSAAFLALGLADICPVVHIIARGTAVNCRPDLMARIEVLPQIKIHLESSITKFHAENGLSGITIASPSGEKELDVRKLVVKIGYAPNTELFSSQLEMDDTGHIKVDEAMRTSAPNVCAVGDIVTPGYARIATALGTASLACKTIRQMIGHVVDH